LLRGIRGGFSPKKFHELCDGKYNTVAFIKIEGSDEIIGGYNPLRWKIGNLLIFGDKLLMMALFFLLLIRIII
jgi:hypothetical protein